MKAETEGNQAKTIFLAASNGFEARYLFRSSLFHELKNAGLRLVLLVPNPEEEYLKKEFKASNIFIERLDIDRADRYLSRSRLQRIARVVRSYSLNPKGGSTFLDDKTNTRIEKRKNKIYQTLVDLSIWGMRHSRLLRRGLVAAESNIFRPSFHKPLFDKYKPSLVITPSPGYQPAETFLLREAKHHKVKTVVVLTGWDSSTSRGLEGAQPDGIVVWSQVMKEEMVRLHNLPVHKIFVGGVPPFDIYFPGNNTIPREELFEKYGLDKKRKLLVFGTKSPATYPHQYLMEVLAKAIQDERFLYPCQLLVRLHPLHIRPDFAHSPAMSRVMEQYQALKESCPFIFYSTPSILSHKLKMDLPWSEMTEMATLLKHCDVLVTLYSTIVVEASLCDTPIVNVNFDPPSEYENGFFPYRSIEVDQKQPQNLRILNSGGSRVAYSEEQLIDAINEYLRDPSSRQEGRRRIVQQECGPTDGLAGRRVAQYIMSFIGKS